MTQERLQKEYEALKSSGALREIASIRNTNPDMMGKGVTITNMADTFNLFDFKAENISIFAIARSLSNQCRYNGSTNGFYSVAQHSVRMAESAYIAYGDVRLAFAVLLHDATECYVSDIPYTLKRELPENVKQIEKNIEKVIFEHFGISEYFDSKLIKYLDTQICNDELEFLLGQQIGIDEYIREQRRLLGDKELTRGGITADDYPAPFEFDYWSPEKAYSMFMSSFYKFSYLIEKYSDKPILTQFGVNTEKTQMP